MQVPVRPQPVVIHGRIETSDPAVAQREAALWLGGAAAAAWGAVLAGVLLGMGRVPWPESLMWSLASALVVLRSVQVGVRRLLGWLLAPCSLELGMSEPALLRRRLPGALARRGYRLDSRSLQRDTYWPARGIGLLPPLAVAWSGPGAIVTGPRWLVRLAARLAVG